MRYEQFWARVAPLSRQTIFDDLCGLCKSAALRKDWQSAGSEELLAGEEKRKTSEGPPL